MLGTDAGGICENGKPAPTGGFELAPTKQAKLLRARKGTRLRGLPCILQRKDRVKGAAFDAVGRSYAGCQVFSNYALSK